MSCLYERWSRSHHGWNLFHGRFFPNERACVPHAVVYRWRGKLILLIFGRWDRRNINIDAKMLTQLRPSKLHGNIRVLFQLDMQCNNIYFHYIFFTWYVISLYVISLYVISFNIKSFIYLYYSITNLSWRDLSASLFRLVNKSEDNSHHMYYEFLVGLYSKTNGLGGSLVVYETLNIFLPPNQAAAAMVTG